MNSMKGCNDMPHSKSAIKRRLESKKKNRFVKAFEKKEEKSKK